MQGLSSGLGHWGKWRCEAWNSLFAAMMGLADSMRVAGTNKGGSSDNVIGSSDN